MKIMIGSAGNFPSSRRLLLLVPCLLLAMGTVSPAAALTLTFDFPGSPGTSSQLGSPLGISGYQIEAPSGELFIDQPGYSNRPDNGTPSLVARRNGAGSVELLVTSQVGPFDLLQLDLAELFNTGVGDPLLTAQAIGVTGVFVGGGLIQRQIVLDFFGDGPGGSPDFETFTFDGQWTNLDRLIVRGTSPTSSYVHLKLDNLTLQQTAVPEPSTALLLSFGLAVLGRRRRTFARRHSHEYELSGNACGVDSGPLWGQGISMSRFRLVLHAAVVLVALVWLGGVSLAAPVTVPPGLNSGDQYRLAFVTSTETNSTSADIAYYNGFVASVANSVPELLSLGANWTAIGSTTAIDARDNTGTNPAVFVGVPIYLLNGALLASSNADLWDGSIAVPLNITESGGVASIFEVTTGTNADGTKRILPTVVLTLGAPVGVGMGLRSTADSNWVQWFTNTPNGENTMYAISSVLTVPLDTDGDGQPDAIDDDDDNDGCHDAIDPAPVLASIDFDGDGYGADCDCVDSNEFVYPGAPEICDGLDNDCNGQTDGASVCGVDVPILQPLGLIALGLCISVCGAWAIALRRIRSII